MIIIDLMEEYIDGKHTAINTIRTMSGMFNPDHAVHILAFVCAITRVEEGDLDEDTFRSVYLKRPKNPEGNIEQHADGIKEID